MSSPIEERFLAEYDAHADAIFRFCYAQCGNRDMAHDLTQETFVRAWHYLVSGRRIDQARPFLYRTARNACIDQSRRHRTTSLDELQDDGFDSPDTTAVAPDVSAEASRAASLIAQLEPHHREVVTLRYLDDLPPRDIARILDISENNVSVRIHRGMQKLRELMGIPQAS